MFSKTCKKCGVDKPLVDFSRLSRSKDGLDRRCRDCNHELRGNKTRLKPIPIDLSKEQTAYLAGLIDGEGYVGLAKSKRSQGRFKGNHYMFPRLVITLTNPVMHEIREEFGFGRVQFVKRRKENNKDRYDWHISSNQARMLLPLVLPFMRVKQKQAKLLLQYLDLATKKDRTQFYRDSVDLVYCELRRLNRRGIENPD